MYPSQYRYEEKRPTISIRIKPALKELLDRSRGDQSYSEFLRPILKTYLYPQDGRDIHISLNAGYERGHSVVISFRVSSEMKKYLDYMRSEYDRSYSDIIVPFLEYELGREFPDADLPEPKYNIQVDYED